MNIKTFGERVTLNVDIMIETRGWTMTRLNQSCNITTELLDMVYWQSLKIGLRGELRGFVETQRTLCFTTFLESLRQNKSV